VLGAIRALHQRLSNVPKHPALDSNKTAWGVAHRHCFSERPDWVHPLVAPLLDDLYVRIKPLPQLPFQLIHGDLNPDNVVVLKGQPPGFIDFTPFWAPVDFAVAMFANWIGPRRGDTSVLGAFSNEPHFEQFLLRASIRMLLVVSELRGVGDWRTERDAAKLVLSYIS
jgi:Ser/Thr protein kinase RdoA (MazF antagonist)